VVGNRVTGAPASTEFGAAIAVDDIADTGDGALLIEGNNADRTGSGLSLRGIESGARVIVRRNYLHDLKSGIIQYYGEGVRFARNRSTDNRYGFELFPDAENNVFIDNVARRNRVANFINDGTANCGSGNTFAIAPC
jgi:nitrous oxidase accessory protein NosD